MKNYNPQKIEKKWQKKWEELNVFKAIDKSKKPKFYVLVEFPYPSGQGLHIGHIRSYVGLDIIARKKRMEGFNVLFPMGWDAFGLPTENYAIKTGIQPAEATKRNTDNYRRQMKALGFSFDWSREINTSEPSYYKWTQWIFIQLFKKGLAYKAKISINWCPACKIGLANEEVIDDKCERCGKKVVKKEKKQWLLKITKYAERLIEDLSLVDYPERVKISQKEWIGKSEGTEIKFQIPNSKFQIPVFTTRPDTLFGCAYLVLAPEHPLIEKLKKRIVNFKRLEDYIKKSKIKSEKKRTTESKEKTGIRIKGIMAVNPANNKKIPIFVADYVLASYGSGAIMAVPAHDRRDFDFAKRYNLANIEVVKPKSGRHDFSKSAYEGEGVLVNSLRFDGLNSVRAGERITRWLENKGLAKKAVYYKLRDWVFSRQRYWGEPIPMIKCFKCGWRPLDEKDLPLKLPKIKEFKPTEKGDSPLAKVKTWLKAKCPVCGGSAQRETDVMPNWAGSNWYYLAYTMLGNQRAKKNKFLASENKYIWDKKKIEYWLPVDWYNGGMEHTTLHLLYSRFIYKFLWDIGAAPKSIGAEPYKKRTSHGMVLGEKNIKMSKSKGNVINPEKVVQDCGADALRVYEMFMGPFEQAIAWNEKGTKGARRFLENIWKLKLKIRDGAKLAGSVKERKSKLDGENQRIKSLIHRTIKKVSEDIEKLKFNTAISALMILAKEMEKQKEISKNYYSLFLILLNPFVPHLTEEIWEEMGFPGKCFSQKWPQYERKLLKKKKIILVVQINGKIRDKIQADYGIIKEKARDIVLNREKIKKRLKNKKIKKIIFVPNRIINFVI